MEIMSKVKTAEYFEIDWFVLDGIIKDEYGRDFSFIEDQDCSNDTSHAFYIDGTLTDYCKNKLTRWKETGDGSLMVVSLLNDLAARNRIKRGNWIVRVSWCR